MRLHYKIILVIIVILSIVIGSIGYLSYRQMEIILKDQLGKNVMDVAWSIGGMEVVQDNVGISTGHFKIQRVVEQIRLKTRVQYIVVMDMQGIRYSHPVLDQIGEHFVGGDEKRVLQTGEAYVSEAVGTLGPSLRAFVPIYREGRQVGAVAVGILTGRIYQEIFTVVRKFMPVLLIGLALGVLGAILLAYSIKRTIFGLEPREIAWLLSEKEAVIQSVKEGIVAINQEGKVTLFNQTARRLLDLEDEALGQTITSVVPGCGMRDVLITGEPVNNHEIKIRPGLTVLGNSYPVRDKEGKIMGAVASFQDMTEIKQMAEELTGFQKMAWALRAQNHEFMNKLHTIAGLIQLGEEEEALQYISQTVNTRQEVLGILTHRIKEPSLAGLLLAKYNKATEARVELEIDEKSWVSRLPEEITADELGSLVGNLIENALDAVVDQGNGHIWVKIWENGEDLLIEIKDNGPGISKAIREQIFTRGVTTKEGQRGWGLSIVKTIVESARGQISFEVNEGTHWKICLPLEGGRDNDSGDDCRR